MYQNQTNAALLAQRIDKQIYQLIRVEFTNIVLFGGMSISEQIQAYRQYGQHQIDFSKIYDLD